MFVGLSALALALAAIGGFLAIIWQVVRRKLDSAATVVGILCVLAFVGAFCGAKSGMYFADRLKSYYFNQAFQSAEPIINALGQYHVKNGQYPESLDQLVPQYLPRIPGTKISAAPDFHYEKVDFAKYDEQATGGYELRIEWYYGPGYDLYAFWPNEKYPKTIGGFPVENQSKWMHVEINS